MKHCEDLPADISYKPEKSEKYDGSLMKTIRVDERDFTNDLSRKVDLPRPRYENSLEFMEKEKFSLPKINKTYDSDSR